MESSIVLGAYQFIGFHLCKHLLDQGIEVLGVDWIQDEIPSTIIEEKEMEIGRNSNFSFKPLKHLEASEGASRTTLFICWYDVVKSNRSTGEAVKSMIRMLVDKFKERNERIRIVLLYPLGYGDEELMFTVDQIIHLPTIYGPWQHDSMVFEQGIRGIGEAKIKAAVEDEYTLDAIYIEDLLASLENMLSRAAKHIIVRSSAADQWALAAREVFDDPFIEDAGPVQGETKEAAGDVYEVNNHTAPKQGIDMQRQHHKRQELLKRWKGR